VDECKTSVLSITGSLWWVYVSRIRGRLGSLYIRNIIHRLGRISTHIFADREASI